MTRTLIHSYSDEEQTSSVFFVKPGIKFTISGYSENSSNWFVSLQKCFSNSQWYNVRQINSSNPIQTLDDGGLFRLYKQAGVTCIIDLDYVPVVVEEELM